MENTRRNFAVSLAASMLAVWLYFGCPPLGPAPSPLAEGSLSNLLAKIAVIPLTLAIFGGGGLAAARALGEVSDDAAAREADRRLLALAAPRVHVMSCNPATLRADLDRLAPGYELDFLRGYDTLPQTPHVEVVAWLRATK